MIREIPNERLDSGEGENAYGRREVQSVLLQGQPGRENHGSWREAILQLSKPLPWEGAEAEEGGVTVPCSSTALTQEGDLGKAQPVLLSAGELQPC